jgi:hypothetical protein
VPGKEVKAGWSGKGSFFFVVVRLNVSDCV